MRILTTAGVPESLIQVLEMLYNYVTINLRVCEKLEQFLSTSGVKKGENLNSTHPLYLRHSRIMQCLDKNGVSQPLT
jgi:hypothetical protein